MSQSTLPTATPPDPSALNAEALYRELAAAITPWCKAGAQLVGVLSGGAWLAQRLHQELGLPGQPGTISSSMHRDDFAKRGLASSGQTQLPMDVNGADIVLLDDVLYTGRTLRAVLNELYDYGRPARVRLAVLVDRGGRELPVQADFAAVRWVLAPEQALSLARDPNGGFSFEVKRTSA